MNRWYYVCLRNTGHFEEVVQRAKEVPGGKGPTDQRVRVCMCFGRQRIRSAEDAFFHGKRTI